jgi:NAD(P)H-dependent flavin oxidoreductase YrpB (nitropropane dioxygenase family)
MAPHALIKKLGVQHMVFQAPIGSIASPELAASVSNAGGLGHLACTWRSRKQLQDLFKTMTSLTTRPYGVNFVMDFPIDEQLETALECGVRVISFFWGDASRYVERLRAINAVAIQVVASVDAAKRAADAGFDLIVAQGREAGGHVRGELGAMALIPQVVDAVAPCPVLGAGGIADHRGVAAAIALGACGVWVGTRFLAAFEADIHAHYRERILAATGDDTFYSYLFDIGWPNAPLRTLRNVTIADWEAAGRPDAPDRPGEGELIARRPDGSGIPRYHFGSPTRAVSGHVEAMALYAGEGVGLVRATESAAKIVEQLAAGMTSTSAKER